MTHILFVYQLFTFTTYYLTAYYLDIMLQDTEHSTNKAPIKVYAWGFSCNPLDSDMVLDHTGDSDINIFLNKSDIKMVK